MCALFVLPLDTQEVLITSLRVRGGWVKWFHVTTRRVWDRAWNSHLVDQWRPLITRDEGTEPVFGDWGKTAI